MAKKPVAFDDVAQELAEDPIGGDLSGASLSAAKVKQASEDFALVGDLTPSQITANQNDYNPASLSTASVLRLSSDASRDITGLAGGSDGRVIVLLNRGAQNIVLKHESVSSTAANRFKFPGSVDMTMIPGASITLIYDATDSRWLAMTMLGTTGTLTLPTVVQHFSDTLGSDLTTTTTMSTSAPVITEGRNLISRSITPTRIGSKIIVRVAVESVHGSTCNKTVALFKDGASTRVAFATVASAGSYDISTCLTYVLTTTSLSAINFELRAGANVGGTYTIKADSNMTIEEWDNAASFTMAPVGSAAPVDASYLALGASAGLSNERVFTPNSQQFTAGDGGAGGNYTLKIGGIERISKTATYAIAAADLGSLIEMNAAGATTLTLPTAVGYEGKTVTIKNIGVGQVTMASTSSQTIDGSTAANTKIDQHGAKTFYSDGANWKSVLGWMRRQVFTAGGTWTCPPGVLFCTVEAIGGGGGGGGSLSSDAVSGAGGAAGERVVKTVPVTPGTGYTVTIGTAGAAGASTGGDGGVGGQTSFGTLVEAMGGSGGSGSASGAASQTIAAVSRDGSNWWWSSTVVGAGSSSYPPSRCGGTANNGGGPCAGFAGGAGGATSGGGGGGASEYGVGAAGGAGGGTGAVGVAAAANTGAGGGGAGNGSTNRAGGAGGTGYMIVTWFE